MTGEEGSPRPLSLSCMGYEKCWYLAIPREMVLGWELRREGACVLAAPAHVRALWCWDRKEEEVSFCLSSTDYHCSYQDLVKFLEEMFLFLLRIILGKFPETLNVFE